jgi:glucose/arabinose dehydrogenase
MTIPRATVAVLLVLVGLVAAGCSDDNDNASSSTTQLVSPDGGGSEAARARGVRLRKVGTFAAPTYVTAPKGDRSRLFVVERGGTIRIVENGRKLARPFLDISSGVRTDGERGLLSMAFAPDYASSGLFYVYFVDRGGDIHIQEFKRSANANVADPASRRNLMTVEHSRFSNHNGGQLQFGPDGFLYAGFGDGGGAGDPFRSAQDLSKSLGKIIRIDPHAAGGRPFGIPSGNPFRGRAGARPEIWVYGVRNPWRFSFDRRTGAMVIADVGQDSQEEVDFSRKGKSRGRNYGWSVFEGRRRYRSGSAPGAVRPNLVKTHSSGWCSITGGYIVRDRSLRGVYGRYVYGDLCKSGIRSVKLVPGGARGDRGLGVSVSQLVSFGEDAAGHVYAVSLNGPVYRLAPK